MRDEVDRYLDAVRRELRGLPRADVDDTIEEMRVHLREEIGERGDAEAVLRDFGPAAEVASNIIERALRPEDAPPAPVAPLRIRYSAWATDVVIGFGPLLLVPTLVSFPFMWPLFRTGPVQPVWVLLVGKVLDAWVASPAERQVTLPPIPTWQYILVVVLVAWLVYYWLVLRRSRSASVGMWMTGLRGVRVDGERVVVRGRDIAQKPVAPGAGRNRWWILTAAIPTGCLCILLLLYYVSFTVGAFLQPWDAWSRPFEERQDSERILALVDDFSAALSKDDRAALEPLVDGVDPAILDELMATGDVFGPQEQQSDDVYVVGQFLTDEQLRREIYVTIEKTSSVRDHEYVDSYRIVGVQADSAFRPVFDPR